MRRVGALLAVLMVGAIADETFGATPPEAGRVPTPGGILVSTSPSQCFTPNGHVKITVHSLAPGASAQASSEDTVSVAAKASSTGTAVITLIAPSALSHGRRVEADLVEVVGTDASGSVVGASTAFILGTKRVCAALNRR
jgi:hypothetical protein